jgi:hypothetical protein
VASLDTTGNFVWVSARDYPNNYDNLHRADYVNDSCINLNRVHGNFYVYSPGWIVMDAMLTYDGSELYYCNAFFDTCITPCSSRIGIAARVNDSTFNTVSNSDSILQNVNDTNYAVYAPHLSADGLELYFTRLLLGGFDTEICVSVRNTTADVFSIPLVLIAEFPNVPEASALNTNGNLMYYHKKFNGTFAIHLVKKITTGTEEIPAAAPFALYPNPADNELILDCAVTPQDVVQIYNIAGELVSESMGNPRINVSQLAEGSYIILFNRDGEICRSTFSICR